ncbi:MAG: molybdopterin converting factor subunit 1 [Candidatus Bipolaricaulota bacterium]|nr:molybdopterin converting factor subunit 1 [Candidatus Bipolaricaulota bacterium]MCS7275037.1 molybdopterin converting factor subunit 1 [Candidatus Bipolaricaulota bacterium]MDW8110365.1 molybdopterin converting factor subunit 1 [Candidatus Bipolaricaulota bacterium]MDW8328739.1 molybdopterin converting factor subunit 1 [Candidatus Bipolaricaulota bacterium]
MRIRVKLFSVIREICGHSELSLDFSGRTVGELWLQLEQQHPALRPLRASRAMAVNRQHAREEHVLHEGDEVAFFPPVSGG